MTTGTHIFTAAQIATALGTTPRSVRRALESIAPTGLKIVSGNQTAAWAFAALPENMRTEIARKACPNYRGPEHLLQDGCKPFAPVAPLASFSPEAINQAAKLRAALAPTFKRMEADISAGELERLGLAEWRAVFKDGISGRHWRRLVDTFKARWRAQGDFERIEIYLDAQTPASGAPSPARPANGIIPELEAVVAACADREAPSALEMENLWTRALEWFAVRIADGDDEKKTRRRLFKFFRCFVPSASKSEAGLHMQWTRKLARWREANGAAGALADRRREFSGFLRAPEITEEDLKKVKARAVLEFNGTVAPAWRRCLQLGEISSPVASYYQAHGKSYVPQRIRNLVKHDVDAMMPFHMGPRFAKLNGPSIDRDWSKVFSSQWFQADDLTAPIYYYVPDGQGWFRLIRGQTLVMIDLRSTCVLGYALIPESGYTANAIRSLITRTCDAHGVPAKGFYFERGIWQRAKAITGKKDSDGLSWPETEQGLREFDLDFIHAITPRSKLVERTLGALQDLMEGDPGYCGRDERKDCPEAFKRLKLSIEARRESPVGKLYSMAEWNERLQAICTEYNNAQQEGKMLGELSPMEGYRAFQEPGNALVHFPAEVRHLFAHQKIMRRVSSSGLVTLKEGQRYACDADTRLHGQEVLVWFNPEAPETVTLTTRERKYLATAARFQGDAVPAIGGGEQLSAAMRQITAAQQAPKTLYRSLKADFQLPFRITQTTRKEVELGAQISEQAAARERLKAERATQAARVQRRAESVGIPREILGDNSETVSRGLSRMARALAAAKAEQETENKSL